MDQEKTVAIVAGADELVRLVAQRLRGLELVAALWAFVPREIAAGNQLTAQGERDGNLSIGAVHVSDVLVTWAAVAAVLCDGLPTLFYPC
jgi:hypothetical protein